MRKIYKIEDERVVGTTVDLMELHCHPSGPVRTAAPSSGRDTLAQAVLTPDREQSLYIWEEGNMPCGPVIFPSEEMAGEGYDSFMMLDPDRLPWDAPGFRPYVRVLPPAAGKKARGGIVMCSGGGFLMRATGTEALPVARELQELGFCCFMVEYRVLPSRQIDAAMDIGRVIRFAKMHSGEYGFDARHLALAGFSAGGMAASLCIQKCSNKDTPDLFDPAYKRDEIDGVNGDVMAYGMVYTFFGDPGLHAPVISGEELRRFRIPPVFSVYGEADPLRERIEGCVDALAEADAHVSRVIMPGTHHGVGALGGWVPVFAEWLCRTLG